MFIGDEVLLDVSFDAARARLADLTRGGSLARASEDAYGEGITGRARAGPLASALGMSRLAEVHSRDIVTRGNSAVLTLRWDATGPGGGLFHALDADITLTPAGKQATLLTLAGAYRPPPGPLGSGPDQVMLHRAAAATIRAFANRVADAIALPPARPDEAGEVRRRRLHGWRLRPRRRRPLRGWPACTCFGSRCLTAHVDRGLASAANAPPRAARRRRAGARRWLRRWSIPGRPCHRLPRPGGCCGARTRGGGDHGTNVPGNRVRRIWPGAPACAC